MLHHVDLDSVQILEISHMTQLIQLIMADSLNGHLLLDILQVIIRSRNCRHTGTRKADLGSGAEFINHIRISCLFTLGKDFKDIILIVFIEMVYIVSIIPVNTEILCRRLQIGKTAYGFVGICDSLRIGIFRHAPDSLNRSILTHQLFNHIHIRAFRSHRHIHHFNPEIFRNSKMSVITGNRT